MSLFVGNLYINIKEGELREIFGRYGNCKIDLKVSDRINNDLHLYRRSTHS